MQTSGADCARIASFGYLSAFDADSSGDRSTEELSQIQQHVAEKVREKFQAGAFSGAAPQAIFDALFADKHD